MLTKLGIVLNNSDADEVRMTYAYYCEVAAMCQSRESGQLAVAVLMMAATRTAVSHSSGCLWMGVLDFEPAG